MGVSMRVLMLVLLTLGLPTAPVAAHPGVLSLPTALKPERLAQLQSALAILAMVGISTAMATE